MASVYACTREFIRHAVVKVFFKDVDVIGAYRIPEEGPVIFVANHANQFVDPMMLITTTSRVIRFLCAAKSMRRPIIGHAARAFEAIGVERPQDLARGGTGSISVEEGATTLSGNETNFLKELQPGTKIKVGETELTVKVVESDTRAVVTASARTVAQEPWKFMPKVDQSDVYGAVHSALAAGDCVGMFPEGGSHDQTSMLELKPGAAIMALGAMNAGAGRVKIVPTGLTYFEPYRFRSRCVVEFGEAIEVPAELAERYKTDKRGAVQELMSLVEEAMKALKPDVKNFEHLQALLTMRSMYKPRGKKLHPEDNAKMLRQFIVARKALQEDEHGRGIFGMVKQYNERLKAADLRDRDVRLNLGSRGSIQMRTAKAFAVAALLLPIALPASLLASPIAWINYYKAQQEKKKALAGSSVKVKALDVVASYKIIVSLATLPVYNAVLAALATLWLRGRGYARTRSLFMGLYWVGVPLAEYGSILACDEFFRALARCRASLRTRGDTLKALVSRRAELQEMVRSYAEEMAPKVIKDYEAERVITKVELQRDWDRMLRADPSLERG